MPHPQNIRSMTRDEVDLAIAWAAGEGWNPGCHDAACFHAADPEGFLIGEVNNEPVSMISAIRYGDDFGFIGFYIVKPEYRGQGYGFAIWQAAMDRLKGRNIGLDGVVDQQDNYRKSGFTLAYRNIRYEGRGAGGDTTAHDLVPLNSLRFEKVLAYDRSFFPADRQSFLGPWVSQSDSLALAVVRDDHLSGYGMRRRCQTGWKIGPLFANTTDDAERLFQGLVAGVPADAPVFLDVPEVNPEAVALAERYNMSVVFETARMYTGPDPELPVDRLFGVTSFELG